MNEIHKLIIFQVLENFNRSMVSLLIQAVFDRWEMIQVAIDSKYYLKTNIIDDSDLGGFQMIMRILKTCNGK